MNDIYRANWLNQLTLKSDISLLRLQHWQGGMSEGGSSKKVNPWVSLTTGCISGGIECVAVWPMEFIKTQLQLQKVVAGVKPPYTGIVNDSLSANFWAFLTRFQWFPRISIPGVISGLVYTVKTTGFLSLYNGLGVTLVGSIPKAGIRFGGNAYCKKLLADDNGKLNMAQQFLAGMGAGTIEAILAVTPMETIKTKLIEVIFLLSSWQGFHRRFWFVNSSLQFWHLSQSDDIRS